MPVARCGCYLEMPLPVFISYSHNDADFAEELASNLVRGNVQVWIDRWELHVGDSILTRIQEAIGGASALIVILSQSSVESEWCKKELNAGLVRELDEKRVVVLPVLVDDCEIPLFLRDKFYADMRTDYDRGLRQILEAVASVTTPYMARIDEPEWTIDYSMDWGEIDGFLLLSLYILEWARDQPYSAMSRVDILGNREATSHYRARAALGEEAQVLDSLTGFAAASVTESPELVVVLEDTFPKTSERIVRPAELPGAELVVHTESRRLGTDTGRDVRLRLGNQIAMVHQRMLDVSARPKS